MFGSVLLSLTISSYIKWSKWDKLQTIQNVIQIDWKIIHLSSACYDLHYSEKQHSNISYFDCTNLTILEMKCKISVSSFEHFTKSSEDDLPIHDSWT